MQVLRQTIKLLALLVMHRPDKVQAVVLAYPMGVNRLVDLLGDRREVIRNEVRGNFHGRVCSFISHAFADCCIPLPTMPCRLVGRCCCSSRR